MGNASDIEITEHLGLSLLAPCIATRKPFTNKAHPANNPNTTNVETGDSG